MRCVMLALLASLGVVMVAAAVDFSGGDETKTDDHPDDTVALGDSTDNLIDLATQNTAIGYEGDDVINGSAGDDILSGNAGDDIILGADGDDRISGGEGNDQLDGESGNDTLSGGEGEDQISGGAGDDDLAGNAGDDTLVGGGGNDVLRAGSGDDNLLGDAGNDTLYAENGSDVLDGGTGDDTLLGDIDGHAGHTQMFGRAGQDTLVLGPGDIATGGDGKDIFVVGDWSIDKTPPTILDFNSIDDTLTLVHNSQNEAPNVRLETTDAGQVMILFDDAPVAILEGVDAFDPSTLTVLSKTEAYGSILKPLG